MKLSVLMVIGAVLALVFGLAFILVPMQTMSLYGITLETGGQWLGRYLGSAFIGIAVLNWRARKAPQGEVLRAVILGNLAIAVTGLIVALLNKISGPGNALVWLTVVIYLFLTLGYGYFQFAKPKASGA